MRFICNKLECWLLADTIASLQRLFIIVVHFHPRLTFEGKTKTESGEALLWRTIGNYRFYRQTNLRPYF